MPEIYKKLTYVSRENVSPVGNSSKNGKSKHSGRKHEWLYKELLLYYDPTSYFFGVGMSQFWMDGKSVYFGKNCHVDVMSWGIHVQLTVIETWVDVTVRQGTIIHPVFLSRSPPHSFILSLPLSISLSLPLSRLFFSSSPPINLFPTLSLSLFFTFFFPNVTN